MAMNYVKRQLHKRGITYKALHNGILSCDTALAEISQAITSTRIDRLLSKWLAHPFTAEDRRAGNRFDISILQAEFSLTPVFERPVQGRVFFEEVIPGKPGPGLQ